MKKYAFLLFVPLLLSFNSIDNNEIDFYKDIKGYDLSLIWSPKTIMKMDNEEDHFPRPEPIGFIGSNYQRFYIHFVSVIQDPNNPYNYFVYGKSKVKNNICTFQGIISIKDAKLYKDSDLGDDPAYKEGKVTGEYIFFEDKKEAGTGIFKGKMNSSFAIDKKGEIFYDALWFIADGYRNNEFDGTWQSYKTSESKTCNWGDFRIPNSGDLDIGVSEFIVDERYSNYGWENFRQLFENTPEAEAARKREQLEWWK